MNRINTTLMDWLAAYGITGNPAGAIYAAVFIVGVITVIFISLRSTSLLAVAAVSLLVEYAITPYALFYDYPPLVLTLFHANAQSLKKPSEQWGRIGLNALMMLSLFFGDDISYRYWIVIALAGLLALTRAARKPEPASMRVPVHE